MARRIRRQLSVIVFLALAGAIGCASAAHAQSLPLSCTGFTDDPLQVGATVKAQHVTELRACVDALRVQAGLAAVTWTDLTLQAGATWIRAVHITELRTALGAVYTAHGETGPAYTDPALTAQATLVRVAHITEIRTAILVVAGVCEPDRCSNDGPIDQAIEYYHLDALGSVRAVTDEVGAVVRRHDYFPFGEGVSAIDGYVQRYAEQEGDPESGLSYVQARYYRAWTGRFTTVDPGHGGGNVLNPQSWNAYTYALNNPTSVTDTTGRNAEGPVVETGLVFRVTITGFLGAGPAGPTIPVGGVGWLSLDPAGMWNMSTWGASAPSSGYEGGGGTIGNQQVVGEQTPLLPSNPSELGPEWKETTPQHPKAPRRFKAPGGPELEFHPKDPKKSPKTWRGRDHWHMVDPSTGRPEKEHRPPGSPVPQATGDQTQQRIITTVGAGMTIYAGYRVIRLLPSLLPPLWPTIVPNVIFP